jgi:hypothetical protein
MEPRLRSAVYGPLYMLLFATSIGVVGLATWFGVVYAHRSPINWIGLSGVAIGFLFYATRQTLPADLSGSLEKVRIVRRFLAWRRLCASAMKFEEDRLLQPKPPRPPAAPVADPEPAQETTAHAQV